MKIAFRINVVIQLGSSKIQEYLKKWYGTGGDFDDHIDEIMKIKILGGIEDLIKKI